MSSANSAQLHYDKMTKTPVHKLVLTLSVPTIISMLVTSIYNMADTFFVSQLGTSATGAVSVVFTLMAVMQAVGFMIGMGSGSLIARTLGERDYEQSTRIASSAFFAAMSFGAVLCFFGIIFVEPLVVALGATETIKPFAIDYISYILFAAPFMCASYVMNNILRGQGKAMLSMIGLTIGGVLNIILDPIFIFVFNWGISGAAIATAFSQFVSFCILLSMFVFKRSEVPLKVSSVSKDIKIYMQIVTTGFPSFCRQGLSSVATLVLNWQARGFGDAAIAAMGVNSRFLMFLFSLVLGLGQALQPVAGFNYGAKKYDRVKNTLIFTAVFGSFLTLVTCIPSFIFAPQIVGAFAGIDAAVLEIGAFAMRAQCMALPFWGMQISLIMALQCTAHTRASSFLSMLRQGIFFIPIILIAPLIFGITGLQLAQPISDILSFVVSLPFFIKFVKELTLLQQMENANNLNKA